MPRTLFDSGLSSPAVNEMSLASLPIFFRSVFSNALCLAKTKRTSSSMLVPDVDNDGKRLEVECAILTTELSLRAMASSIYLIVPLKMITRPSVFVKYCVAILYFLCYNNHLGMSGFDEAESRMVCK